MVSVQFKQKKAQCPRQFLDDCHSGVVLLYMGKFAGALYQDFLGKLLY